MPGPSIHACLLHCPQVQAVSKLQKAREINPAAEADADWVLGNAYTSLGFLSQGEAQALEQFRLAAECFRRCSTKVWKEEGSACARSSNQP